MRASYHGVISAMKIIAAGGVERSLTTIGVHEKDYVDLTGPVPWTMHDAQRMQTVIEKLAQGTSTAAGLPVFQLPVEYYAAVIATFVHPTNFIVACNAIGRRGTTEDFARGTDFTASIDPRQAFALVLQAVQAEQGQGEYRSKFEKAMMGRLQQEEEKPNAKKVA